MPTTGISTDDPAETASEIWTPEPPQIEGRMGSRGDGGGGTEALTDGS